MILGYPDRPSGFPGDDFVFHIATDAPMFRVEIYDAERTWLWASPVQTPVTDMDPNPQIGPGDADWNWPAYTITMPDFASGAYIAFFSELLEGVFTTPDFVTIDGDAFKPLALFVLKSLPGQEAPILYKLSWATFNAYNWSGDPPADRYKDRRWDAKAKPPGYKVTIRR